MNKKRVCSKATSPRKINGSSAQGGDGLSSKRFRIITEEEDNKWCLQQAMQMKYKYIPEKDVKETILIKTPKQENLDPIKKLNDFLQELLKQKKRLQGIAIYNTLEKVKTKSSTLWDHCKNCGLWLSKWTQEAGSSSSNTVEMDTVLELSEKTVLLIGQCNNTITYVFGRYRDQLITSRFNAQRKGRTPAKTR